MHHASVSDDGAIRILQTARRKHDVKSGRAGILMARAQYWRISLVCLLRRSLSYTPTFFLLALMRRADEPFALAGAGMATMYCNIFGLSLIVGLGGALAPLASQAHGARERQRVREEQICRHSSRVKMVCVCDGAAAALFIKK